MNPIMNAAAAKTTPNVATGTTKTKTPTTKPPEVAVAPAPMAIANVDPLHAAFSQIEREMNATFAEREREIRGLTIALLAREHLLLLGPAGTAKSAMANTMCFAIRNARFFQHLLTRFSSPEELYGPVSLAGLKEDKYRRVIAGKFPECEIAFLDEIYKANSAVLNSLLTAINERKFDNDGGRNDIPLETLVGASNELPEGPELAALHDRFLLRYWVSYTKTPDAFRRLLVGAEPSISSAITLEQLKEAQAQVEAMPISETAIEELFRLRGEVAAEGIVASDRRWRKAVRILKAAAWLDGATEVTPESFPILAHVLWETTEQVAKLTQTVSRYTSAELAEAQECADAIMELTGTLPDKKSEQYGQALVSVVRELKRAADRLRRLEKQCGGSTSKTRIGLIATEVETKYKSMKLDAAAALDL